MATAVLSKYKLIIPSEHGSWSLTLVPFIIGAGGRRKVPRRVRRSAGCCACWR